jgi:hypothetical protein
MIFAMTAPSARRLVLVPVEPRRSAPAAESAESVVRRYRLARRRLDGPTPPDRFGHLKRAHD